MHEQLERSSTSLLYEGYALYPYTPGATKNATPTPFGIVYPPAYAERSAGHLRPRCGSSACSTAAERRRGERRGPLPAGGRRAPPGGRAARLELADRRRGCRPSSPLERGVGTEFEFEGEPPLRGRAAHAERRRPRRRGVAGASAAASTTRPSSSRRPRRWSAAEALRRQPALHPRRARGRAAGASSRRWSATGAAGAAVAGCESVNTWPVLAAPDDDASSARADHASRPPAARAREPRQPVRQHRDRGGAAAARAGAQRRRARGDRGAGPGGARDDRASRGGDAASSCSALHGSASRPRIPRAAADAGAPSRPPIAGPPPEPPGHPNPGEQDARDRRASPSARAARWSCARAPTRDVYDRMLDGRTATIERIYLDYDGRAPTSAVTIDDDPAQELFRETGRYLFFKAAEVEAVGAMTEPSSPRPQILVAGIGNAWMRDDGFGGKVAKALSERELPDGRHGARLRHRRARPRLRGDARLRRAACWSTSAARAASRERST